MTEVNLPVHIRINNLKFLTPERIGLLRKIQQTGSLRESVRLLSMSYQNAWTIIEEINQVAPRPLVSKQRGGSGGGGAVITEYGNLILKEYLLIEQQVLKFQKKLNTELNL